MQPANPYCEALGIPVPALEHVRKHPDANYYSMLMVVLLERGGPVTLEQAARRFEEAGVAPAAEALRSLKRCKPGRSPIYRDGDLYELDPHDEEADLWAFRLGLRPAKATAIVKLRLVPEPLPSIEVPLTVAVLDEAWRGGVDSSWSAQRLAICVLDAHGGGLHANEVIAFVKTRCRRRVLSAESAQYWRRGAPVFADDAGTWRLDPTHEAVRSARAAVRNRLDVLRRNAHLRSDPVEMEATERHFERERAEHAAALARMSRVILHAFPARQPQALVLLDVRERTLTTLMGRDVSLAGEMLARYDIIAAMGVRELLRALRFDWGERRLGELGPPQKSMTIDQRGRTLKITTSLLIQGSCGISRPFGAAGALHGYLGAGELAKLKRRLEADAKALHAIYQFGRLHGCARVRWGFLDELIPAPWVHRDEPMLHELMKRAQEHGVPLEVVVGSAPGWDAPWSRAERAYVLSGENAWELTLVDEQGRVIDINDVQLARVVGEADDAT